MTPCLSSVEITLDAVVSEPRVTSAPSSRCQIKDWKDATTAFSSLPRFKFVTMLDFVSSPTLLIFRDVIFPKFIGFPIFCCWKHTPCDLCKSAPPPKKKEVKYRYYGGERYKSCVRFSLAFLFFFTPWITSLNFAINIYSPIFPTPMELRISRNYAFISAGPSSNWSWVHDAGRFLFVTMSCYWPSITRSAMPHPGQWDSLTTPPSWAGTPRCPANSRGAKAGAATWLPRTDLVSPSMLFFRPSNSGVLPAAILRLPFSRTLSINAQWRRTILPPVESDCRNPLAYAQGVGVFMSSTRMWCIARDVMHYAQVA